MTVAVARDLLQQVVASPQFRFRATTADTGDGHHITGLKYFSGSMLWAWIGPNGERAQAPFQLPQEPWGFATRELAEQAAHRCGFTISCVSMGSDGVVTALKDFSFNCQDSRCPLME